MDHLTNYYGIPCWICTEAIRAGENFRKDIAQAIKQSQLVVLIQSRSSAASVEVSKEILFALKKGKMVKPFLIEESELSDELELELSTTHYIDATSGEFDDHIKTLAKDICQTLGKPFEDASGSKACAVSGEVLLSTPSVIPKKIFFGRDDVLAEINEKFSSGERLLFLYGIGGIGKTQIAKQYAKQYKDNYDVIIYATYDGSLRNLIIADSPFCIEPEMARFTLSDNTKEDDGAFFARKLEKIKKLSNSRTLIIIDNFDVDDDCDLEELMDGRYHLLITTRHDYSRYFPTVKIEPISSDEALRNIFFKNYDGFDVEEDDEDLPELFTLINRHTYTIELLAQHMENSGQTVREMIDALKKEGITSLNEKVSGSEMNTRIAYENLLKMFRMFALSDEEKQVLMYLSLMPLEGINLKDFRNWAELSSNQVIKSLEGKSWIVRNTEGIALHPIICEVVKHELPVNAQNCGGFIDRFAETITDTSAWHMKKTEKDRYAGITRCVLSRFPEITPATLMLYRNAESLFSFAVDPSGAAILAEKLWDYCLGQFGENHYDTGFAAFKRGWLYTYNSQLPDSVKQACIWLEKADSIFKNVKIETQNEIGSYVQNKTNLAKMQLILYEQSGNREMLENARKHAEGSLEFAIASFDRNHRQYGKVAGAYWQLADILCVSGAYDEALSNINAAIELLTELYTENDSDTIFAMYRKAMILYKTEKYTEAEALAEKSAVGYSDFFGQAHPNTCKTLLLWGDCCASNGKKDAARKIYENALESAELIYAPDSVQIAEIKEKLETL